MDLFWKRLTKQQYKRNLLKAKPKQKNRPLFLLPSHILAIILSNLDFATLSSNQDEFAAALPEVSSLSTSLPPSMFLPERSRLWYGKILNFVLKHVTIFVNSEEDFPYSSKLFDFGFETLQRLHMPRIHPSGRCLFQKLTGLESLEVEHTVFSANDPFTLISNPGTWLRWDAKLGTSKPHCDYLLYVLGDIVSRQGIEVVQDDESPELKSLRRRWTMIHHATYQPYILLFLIHERVKEVVIKDPEKRGKIVLGPEFMDRYALLYSGCRMILYYLPGVLNLESSNSSVQIKDTWLFFVVDDCKGLEEDEDDSTSIDDCLRACLGNADDVVGGKEEDEEHKELKEVVMKILADDNREIVFEDSSDYVG